MHDGTHWSATSILTGAGAFGVLAGLVSVAWTPDGRTTIATRTHDAGVLLGLKRQREPQPGDHWAGCDAARFAGTAPIYRGEPGYHPDMDGDDDGIACEPIR